jgi:hypothetical protein
VFQELIQNVSPETQPDEIIPGRAVSLIHPSVFEIIAFTIDSSLGSLKNSRVFGIKINKMLRAFGDFGNRNADFRGMVTRRNPFFQIANFPPGYFFDAV